jgi:hypothetical protein
MVKPPSKAWPVFAALTVMVIIAAGLSWSLAHPYGIYWDEAEYFNQAATDLQRLHSGELLRLGGRTLVTSLGRPPGISPAGSTVPCTVQLPYNDCAIGVPGLVRVQLVVHLSGHATYRKPGGRRHCRADLLLVA